MKPNQIKTEKVIPDISRKTLQTKRKPFTLKLGSRQLTLGSQTRVMGIINMTPDSFSQDGCLTKNNNSLEYSSRLAQRMIKEGADILDIGGESSRPGSIKITAQEEINRVIPLIKKLSKSADIPISIDTYKTSVAKHALDNGAVIINNIMGAQLNRPLLKMAKNYNAVLVLMHMRGIPKTMQKSISYQNVVKEIIHTLKISIENCLEIGIKSDKIVIDPGIGFGKTVENNLEIINRLKEFQVLNKPLLVGTSRKSFIGHILDKEANQRLNGTLASVAACVLNGAHIIRVHDVKETKEAALISDAIINEGIIE